MIHEGEPPQSRVPAVDNSGNRPPLSDGHEDGGIVGPKLAETDSAAPIETRDGDSLPAPGQEQIIFEPMSEAEQQDQATQTRLDRLRQLNTERVRRYRKRHPERARAYNTAYRRKKRAEQREQRGQQGPDAK